MNEFLDERYIEITARLVLGVEPRDAARGTRVTAPITVAIEFPLSPPIALPDLERLLLGLQSERRTLSNALTRLGRHTTCRYVLVFRKKAGDHVDLRLFDEARRFAPRRLHVPLTALTDPTKAKLLDAVPLADRARQPALFPGRTYDVSESATGLRGRVLRHDPNNAAVLIPVRWPRVMATVGGSPVGWAHGDEHGDFLLLIDRTATPALTLPWPLTADVTAFGPGTLPVPVSTRLPDVDEYWDLPLEKLAAPGVTPDLIADGDYIPTSYTASSPLTPVTFTYGALLEGLPAFTIV